MSSFITEDGIEMTDEMMEKMCEVMEADEWPEGFTFDSPIYDGLPPIGGQGETLSVKVSLGLKRAAEKRAQEQGVTMSTYLRHLIENDVISAA